MRQVTLVEVGPRDGLQNESRELSIDIRHELIRKLAAAGLKDIEAGAFVSPKWVPQMAGSAELLSRLDTGGSIRYPVLVPNLKGLEAAMAAGARDIAVFGAASETFSRKNINCGIEESLERFAPVIREALGAGIRVRGYVSCVAACPYEGDIAPGTVAEVADKLFQLGCHQISLGDTIGTGTPGRILAMLDAVSRMVPVAHLAGHYHDTYGMAIANIRASLDAGLRTFDASVAGLGGCPYARGASGNVATEDVAWMLEREGFVTGVDLPALLDAAGFVSQALGREPASKVARAFGAPAAAS
ncbi:hydroxymethylglutaryl-CoA lyase [Paludibacterium paludis]|uniref:hydroxymethylglutaryl-CoA lyase n=1 Tax=Paludibacterium paludis TaxID=1225769 RepID=A0A918NYT3_9NEIS|nr:hydroxymethylglutaryl-CoA lyase [Paludibacterium paludis]GGY06104.1 hydroxymethylglutaryl-CoA lyase [Paludibacterium paludis]